jgi:hypothetical protein
MVSWSDTSSTNGHSWGHLPGPMPVITPKERESLEDKAEGWFGEPIMSNARIHPAGRFSRSSVWQGRTRRLLIGSTLRKAAALTPCKAWKAACGICD